ncbi:MAG: glycosyltransferase family 2 protein [Acidimicrobiia bacterium]
MTHETTTRQTDGTAEAAPMTVSIILPAYNEAEALPVVVDDIRSSMPDAEIIVVDDASTDSTASEATALGCIVRTHKVNKGKGSAMRTGFDACTGQAVIFMDADATYPASAIPKMVELLGNHQYVRADRDIDASNTPWVNRVGNTVMERTLQTLHGLDRGDHLSGLYGFQRDTFAALHTEAKGFDIEVEIGIKVKEQGVDSATMPIEYLPRVGEKKLSPLRDGLRILGRILRLVLIYRPLMLFGLPGAIITVLALVAAIALANGPIVTGYLGLSIHTFIVAALGILAGFQLMIFGVASAVYKRQLGFHVSPTVATLTSPKSRTITALIGTTLVLICGIWLLITIISWLVSGGPEFTNTRTLVAASTGAVFGLQMLSASLFITLLSDGTT